MLNIIELSYGNVIAHNKSKIHVFNPIIDIHEHAHFINDKGDFYQIVLIDSSTAYYHYQKTSALIYNKELEDQWWENPKSYDFSKILSCKNTTKDTIYMQFYEKIIERLKHNYKIKRLVIQPGRITIPENHDDFKEYWEVYKTMR